MMVMIIAVGKKHQTIWNQKIVCSVNSFDAFSIGKIFINNKLFKKTEIDRAEFLSVSGDFPSEINFFSG